MSAAETSPHPYEALTPDRALDALATVGILGDGRLQALGSYENRVYLVGVEDAEPVVAKFYRRGGARVRR
jgi:Ser/Thr protein kinase RdoA (MazF antagonist)